MSGAIPPWGVPRFLEEGRFDSEPERPANGSSTSIVPLNIFIASSTKGSGFVFCLCFAIRILNRFVPENLPGRGVTAPSTVAIPGKAAFQFRERFPLTFGLFMSTCRLLARKRLRSLQSDSERGRGRQFFDIFSRQRTRFCAPAAERDGHRTR